MEARESVSPKLPPMTAAPAAKVPLYSSPGSARTLSRRVPAFATGSVPLPPAVNSGSVTRLLDQPRESWRALAWMLAVAVCFVGAGLAGTVRPVVDSDWKERRTIAPPAPVVPVEDISMADFADSLDEPDAAAGPPDQPLTADEKPPEPLLTEEDVFDVPPAAPIESALRIVEPTPVRPSPTPRPRPAESSPSRPAAASATNNGATPPASTGGAGGPATSGRGGKGKFPKPPYPAFAKAKGLTGTVTLSIKVSAAGDVTSASVSGSSGSSELDNHAASWVSRRWKWPAGAARSYRLPVSFRLR